MTTPSTPPPKPHQAAIELCASAIRDVAEAAKEDLDNAITNIGVVRDIFVKWTEDQSRADDRRERRLQDMEGKLDGAVRRLGDACSFLEEYVRREKELTARMDRVEKLEEERRASLA